MPLLWVTGAEKSVKEEQARGWPEGRVSSKALKRKVLGVFEDPRGLVSVGRRTEGRVTAEEAKGEEPNSKDLEAYI